GTSRRILPDGTSSVIFPALYRRRDILLRASTHREGRREHLFHLYFVTGALFPPGAGSGFPGHPYSSKAARGTFSTCISSPATCFRPGQVRASRGIRTPRRQLGGPVPPVFRRPPPVSARRQVRGPRGTRTPPKAAR